MKILTLDFETEAIDFATNIPPKPVSYAFRTARGRLVWRAWGHPEGNNTSERDAALKLMEAFEDHDALLCHNVGFDAGVATHWLNTLGVPVHVIIDDMTLHDTQVLAFLNDPYATTTSLKPLAERYLGEPPEEQDAVREWLIANKIVPRSATKSWGAHISKAPGDVVKPYCIGDVTRTWKLFQLWERWHRHESYRREMRTLRVTRRMTRRGVPINGARVAADTGHYEGVLAKIQKTIIKDLHAPTDFDFEKRGGLAEVVESRYGIALPLTKTGRKSTAKDTVESVIPDARMRGLLRYEGALRYYLKNYLRPWSRLGDCVHVEWRTTATDAGGARTGRLSSSPNFQNLVSPDTFDAMVAELARLTRRKIDLPVIRSYVEAPEGHVIVGADYSQIELRITAHYEDGMMAEHYRRDPKWDLHQFVVDRVMEMYGTKISRLFAKRIGFGIIYGMGGPGVAATLGMSVEEGYDFKDMYLAANPGLNELIDDVKARGRSGGKITTLGGREYRVEPAREIKGELRTFEYKLTNYLVQGGAADLMKEAMVAADAAGLDLILSVHDEPVTIARRKDAKAAGLALVDAMLENDLVERITVPLLANSYTAKRWSEAEK